MNLVETVEHLRQMGATAVWCGVELADNNGSVSAKAWIHVCNDKYKCQRFEAGTLDDCRLQALAFLGHPGPLRREVEAAVEDMADPFLPEEVGT